jgi:hypothetical protein
VNKEDFDIIADKQSKIANHNIKFSLNNGSESSHKEEDLSYFGPVP